MIDWIARKFISWMNWHPPALFRRLDQAEKGRVEALDRLHRQMRVNEAQTNVLAARVARLLRGSDQD